MDTLPRSSPPDQYFSLRDLRDFVRASMFTDRKTDGTDNVTSTAEVGGKNIEQNYHCRHEPGKQVHVTHTDKLYFE